MTYDDEDVFNGGGMKFLSTTRAGGPRRSPSRQGIKGRRSSASLRGGTSLAQALDGEPVNGQHSLAHELAFAMMPDQSAGSKFLAEEFGIEYDAGAEGIDEQATLPNSNGLAIPPDLNGHAESVIDSKPPSLTFESPPSEEYSDDIPLEPETPVRRTKQKPVLDPMDSLAQDLETIERFLANLRRLDSDGGPSSSQPSLEKIASDVIRRIDETVRNREGQVRELLEYEREFRKMAGEINGNDVLGTLEPLEEIEGLTTEPPKAPSAPSSLEPVREARPQNGYTANDWETDPDENRLGDDDGFESEPETPSPAKDSFPSPPSITGPPTPASALPYFAHLRSVTASLATSLVSISEHAQVNGAATTDAGRKIRALKNKLGGWRVEWDSAEKSRIKIERWEAGLPDDGSASVPGTPTRSGTGKRVDGRRIVEEQLRAFEIALADAGMKTQAIMARS